MNGVAASGKRKRDADEADLGTEEQSKKRGRVLEQPVKVRDDVINIDDDADDGAIMIDDD